MPLINSTRAALKPLSRRWMQLIGPSPQFTLEARTFHAINLGATLLCIGYIPYNIFAGLYVAAASCMVICGIFYFEYYRSRFKGKPYRSLLLGLLGLVIFSINYFSNAGIEGSTDMMWTVYLLMVLTISPYKQHLPWLLSYLLVFTLVHIAEYLHPQLVIYPFHYGKGRLIDRITAFPIPVISTYIIISRFRKAYDKERAMVEQHDAEKSKLLSILSHDLRTPFIQIRQYLDLLNDTDISAEERRQMIDTLGYTNDQTLEMLTNMLYWSRSQLAGSVANLVPLPLLETLRNTLAVTGSLAAQKHIKVDEDIDPAITVKADADMLQLVVRNLVQNAVKFTPEGGNIRLTASTQNSMCRVSISDNGTGIPAEQMPGLFTGKVTPAYGTSREKGVGLGLLLCRDFMERQGGRITAESQPGKGSTFTIELPVG